MRNQSGAGLLGEVPQHHCVLNRNFTVGYVPYFEPRGGYDAMQAEVLHVLNVRRRRRGRGCLWRGGAARGKGRASPHLHPSSAVWRRSC